MSDRRESIPGSDRAQVDEREWAVRHLEAAIAADSIAETDYHVSLARQLLAETATADATRCGNETRRLDGDA